MSWNKFESSLGPLSYHTLGSGSKTAIFIHGGMGGIDPAAIILRQLGPDWQIISPILPNHGKSFSLNDSSTYIDFQNSLHEFIQDIHNKKGTIVLIGHSFGGRVAWDLSHKSPLLIKKIMLISPLLSQIPHNFITTARLVSLDFLRSFSGKITDTWEYGLAGNFLHPHKLARVWKIIKSMPAVTENKAAVPTVIVWGNKDAVLPLNQPFLSTLKSIELIDVPMGHYGFNKGDHWNKIREFLK